MSDRRKDEERRERNQDLIRRMKAGESLTLYKASDTFFPPRPMVKKDKKIVAELFVVRSEDPTA